MIRKTPMMIALTLLLAACGDDGVKSGNSEVCRDGETCNNDCTAQADSCEIECARGSECSATCREGQQCQFNCAAGATCDFNCAEGTCLVQGAGADCMCSGNCTGTCMSGGGSDAGSSNGAGGMGGAGGGGGDCVDACGSPLDPGYADCVAACQ